MKNATIITCLNIMFWMFVICTSFALAEEPCNGYKAGVKRVYFGDLHVHTSYSLDAYAFGTRNDPSAAYSYAKGNELILAGGIPSQLERPLDFAAVTDHAEFFHVTNMCTFPQYRDDPYCVIFRYMSDNAEELGAPGFRYLEPMGRVPPEQPDYCKQRPLACKMAMYNEWKRTQIAATKAYERCEFTTFNAYEWTASPNSLHLHRNIIFANDTVPAFPIDYLNYPNPNMMWGALERECIKGLPGCDVLAIAHNSNFSNGFSFNPSLPGYDDIALRSKFEKLVEIFQGKGNSECLNPYQDDTNRDCMFERIIRGKPGMDQTEWDQMRSGYVRTALGNGLKYYAESGSQKLNPLQLGFIGSTDTHNATPGAVKESAFKGNHGVNDNAPEERIGNSGNNPGGLVAVWAEENTRESIFAAMKRRETYATSGPRMTVRFFQTWSNEDPCQTGPSKTDIPMGGMMTARQLKPRFVVNALMDQRKLDRIDIIKGSYVNGEVVEQIHSRYSSDRENGDAYMCRVFEDSEYDPVAPAFWYARVLEKTTRRWSYYDCQALGNCNSNPGSHLIQERAWASPIWNLPE